jgi:hypothetical protein
MQPLVIEDNIAVAATTDVPDVISQNSSLQKLRRLPYPCIVKLVAVTSAASLRIAFDIGSQNFIDLSDVRVGTDLQDPQDLVNDEMIGMGGDILSLRAVNLTGGSLSLRYRIVAIALSDLGITDIKQVPITRVIQRTASIANNTVDSDQMAGLRYERPQVDSVVKIFATASASGLLRQMYVETTQVAPPSAIAPLNRMPQDPFDMLADGIQVPDGKKFSLLIGNASGGAITFNWKAKFQEIG